MSGEVFYGWTDGQTADKKRRKNFVLGLPKKGKVFCKVQEKTFDFILFGSLIF